MSFAENIITYYENLSLDLVKSKGVTILDPFESEEARQACKWFHQKFYNSRKKRILLLGINPGRLGTGITGIPFTDPVLLERMGFENTWQKRHELSAQFIHEMIAAYGGQRSFSRSFYLSSVCPLGFIKDKKNLNYYDEPSLIKDTRKFIIKSIEQQIEVGCRTDVVFCLGKGKNHAYLKKLNDEFSFFDEVIPLPHPRWVMQYRLKDKAVHIGTYVDALNQFR